MKCDTRPDILQGVNERCRNERIQAIELRGKKRVVFDEKSWDWGERNCKKPLKAPYKPYAVN